ncbi:hypothetical protein P3102_19590 [Amycolatopsis sp. QT-25]|uniref:hypothetical protein n=1 Tax=Amycolatopsis sp. QT-25 TaxID=3034022 RepID=UPI0023EC575F|nr:hypothetical protein [Amycolatopsis sp. QT-25]WET76336.1 hypothetical protein P3102_19590 [Amycolatopsis sp. QT-25]
MAGEADVLGHIQTQAWSAHGDVTDGMNDSVTYAYDSLSNLKGGELANSTTASAGYTDTAHPHLPTQVSDRSGIWVGRSPAPPPGIVAGLPARSTIATVTAISNIVLNCTW